MLNNLYSLLPVAIFVLIIVVGVNLIGLVKNGLPWSKKKRNPFTSNFLRGPGQSIQKQLDDLKFEVFFILFQLFITPMILLLFPLLNFAMTNQKTSLFNIVLYSIIIVVFMFYLFFKLYKTVKKIQKIKLGYEGEVAVGQELNQLMLKGYRVFHDFPAGKFNIDHIVVGNTGVFAVETKARSKPTTDDRKKDAQLEYDGKTLKFPHWIESKPIEQAIIQADWLKNWLSKAIGEQVFVEPVLAVPGWFITRKSPLKPYIYNGKKPEKLFLKINNYPLSETMVQRICHQLDAKCRDIEPEAYVENKKL